MATSASASNQIFHTVDEFNAAMFPQATKQAAESENEQPHVVGARMAEEALDRLRRATAGNA